MRGGLSMNSTAGPPRSVFVAYSNMKFRLSRSLTMPRGTGSLWESTMLPASPSVVAETPSTLWHHVVSLCSPVPRANPRRSQIGRLCWRTVLRRTMPASILL